MSSIVQSLEADQADVRGLIQGLFKHYALSYTIDPHVQATVTLSSRNCAFDTTLENILRQVDATYRMDSSGVIAIYHKRG